MRLTKKELMKVIKGKAIGLNSDDPDILGISVDSRSIRAGEVFFAIRGERYDGHDFVDEALRKGCLFSVVDRHKSAQKALLVKDTRLALCLLARYYRKKFNPTTIAITGSNGKTTTKELTHLVLEQKYNVLAAPGSYNNDIGVPLTIFNLYSEHEILLLEFGMNHSGEIKHLSVIAIPKIGIITNIAPVHIGNFSSLDDILMEKLELAKSCQTVVLNGDDGMLRGALKSLGKKDLLIYGIECGDLRARDISLSDGGSKFIVDGVEYSLPLIGRHNIYNALASIAVGDILGVGREVSSIALKGALPQNGRDRRITIDNCIVIDSTYNSNPVSLIASIESMRLIEGRKILVLGDMLELGDDGLNYHREIGERLKEYDIDALFTFGRLAREIAKTAEIPCVSSYSRIGELIKDLKLYLREGDVILVKGSRMMKMERIIESLIQKKNRDDFRSS